MSAPVRQRAIRRSSIAAVLGGWWCLVNALATGAEIDFYRDVYPVLKSNCIACHNKTTTKAALNMETPEAMHKGGDSGEGVIAGNGAESLIFRAAAHMGDIAMPPKGNKSGALTQRTDFHPGPRPVIGALIFSRRLRSPSGDWNVMALRRVTIRVFAPRKRKCAAMSVADEPAPTTSTSTSAGTGPGSPLYLAAQDP